MAAKYELKKTPSGKFMFNLKAANGQVILTSQLYSSKASAVNGIKSARKNGSKKSSFEVRKGKNGSPYFVLMAGNKEIIGRSEMYSGNRGAKNGIASVMRNAGRARTAELE